MIGVPSEGRRGHARRRSGSLGLQDVVRPSIHGNYDAADVGELPQGRGDLGPDRCDTAGASYRFIQARAEIHARDAVRADCELIDHHSAVDRGRILIRRLLARRAGEQGFERGQRR